MSDRRRLALLVVTAVIGAGCCAAAAALTWWTARFTDALVGAVTTRATGSDLLPELVPVALLALAGLGATAATRGWPRRVIGGLLVAGGVVVAVRSVLAMTSAPAVLHTALTRPATLDGAPVLRPAGAIVALVGGLLVAVAGTLVIAGAGRARGMGARYDAPARRAARAARAAQAQVTPDDPGGLWRAQDAGADPTEAEPGDRSSPDPAALSHPSPPATAPDLSAPATAPDLSPPSAATGDNPTGPVIGTRPGRIP